TLRTKTVFRSTSLRPASPPAASFHPPSVPESVRAPSAASSFRPLSATHPSPLPPLAPIPSPSRPSSAVPSPPRASCEPPAPPLLRHCLPFPTGRVAAGEKAIVEIAVTCSGNYFSKTTNQT
ncbi:unnamed protein product, partial [Closterium sp. NIES-54]